MPESEVNVPVWSTIATVLGINPERPTPVSSPVIFKFLTVAESMCNPPILAESA